MKSRDKAVVVRKAIIAKEKPVRLAVSTRRTGLAKTTARRLPTVPRSYEMIAPHHERCLVDLSSRLTPSGREAAR